MNIFYVIVSWIYTRMFFGPKCPDYETECCVCEAWKDHEDFNQ